MVKPEEEVAKEKKEAVVYDNSEKEVRVYTEEHSDPKGMKDGKAFVKKAEGYAKKIGGSMKLR